ncbi:MULTISPECIES: SPOR domain-containing protein [unclassified Pseudoalteromonas]|uniref:SPOR domain-containing protein n=1 Tax=unclassified Pseudoalteromonas TaxID=194690 RepID=UPI003014A536
MERITMKRVSRLAIAMVTIGLVGCEATAEKAQLKPLEIKKQLALLNSQVAELQKEVAQLKEVKQQVARFEEVQQDLDIIAEQLTETLVLAQDGSSKVIDNNGQNTKPGQGTQTLKPEFAIQLASTTNYTKAKHTYKKLKKKLPAQFQHSEVNIEQVRIKNTDYYRLKLGAFQDKAAAFKGCQKLKNIGLNCLVSHYTSHKL